MGRYGIIYKIENTINGKVYIGQTVNSFNKRYECTGIGIERVYKFHNINRESGYSYNKHLISSIEKYGFENFEIDDVFDTAYSKEELNEKEIYWIKYFDSKNNGYNKTDGGDGGSKKEMVCLTTGEIYDSISTVKNKFKCDSFDIFRPKIGRNTGKLDGKDLIWMKKDDYDKYDCDGSIYFGRDDLLENLADYILENNKVKDFKIYTKYSFEKSERKRNEILTRNDFESCKDKNINIINEYNEFRTCIIEQYQNKEKYKKIKTKLSGKVKLFGLSEKLKKISRELKYDIEELETIFNDRRINFNCKDTFHNQELNIEILNDKEIIKYLLRLDKPNDFNDDLYSILMDLDNLIIKSDLTEKQRDAIYWHRTGLTVSDIGDKLNISGSCVSRHIDDAIKKIIITQKEIYEKDFLYLYKKKGIYKKCSKCGEIKLINEYHKHGKGKTASSCKQCRYDDYKIQKEVDMMIIKYRKK